MGDLACCQHSVSLTASLNANAFVCFVAVVETENVGQVDVRQVTVVMPVHCSALQSFALLPFLTIHQNSITSGFFILKVATTSYF